MDLRILVTAYEEAEDWPNACKVWKEASLTSAGTLQMHAGI